MTRSIRIVAALMALAVAPASWATTISETGTGFDVPDNNPGGASSNVNVTDDLVISSLNVTLNSLSGTWVGDLVVTLTGPGGSADLMFRTGDAQGDCCGDSSDLGGNYQFADGGADWWAAAAATGGGDIIPGGTYGATTATGTGVSLDTVFGGMSSLGAWTLTVADLAAGDLHTFDMGDWVLEITGDASTVPEPGLLSLMGLGLAGLGFARRRRQ